MRSIELPGPVAAVLSRLGRGTRATAAAALSERYRQGASSATGHVVRTPAELAAYATVRFPATHAAAVAAFTATAGAAPGFAPTSLLDVGSGLGATAAAALAVWPSIVRVTCVEPDARAVAGGREVLAAAAPDVDVTWVTDGWAGAPAGRADLVTAGYVGNELADPVAFATGLWARTDAVLVVVEPGRMDTYRGLLAARDAVLADGGHTLAPCPHDDRCPLHRSDWCHFGQRLPRSAAHRQAKGADQNFEDEKYSYVAIGRAPRTTPAAGRVIRRPARRKGLVELPLCRPDGTAGPARVGRSSPAYRDAKDVTWGDAWPPPGA